VGPGVFNNFDLPLNISQGQSVTVTVEFDERVERDQREVWPLIFYMFPTKGVVETVARFVNQSETSFILGWENASFLNVFITGFVIRVFYYGSPAVVANFTIVRLENPTKVAGIGFLYASAIPLWLVIILSRKKTSPNLTS
jgi:hypothetical protein